MKNVLNDMDLCTGCGCCENICKRNAITFQENEEGFLYPIINPDKCVDCGNCTINCPSNKKKEIGLRDVKLYSAYTRDTVVRLTSSSGGVFYSISRYVINKGGVVFGAEFDSDFNIRHNYIESINEIKRFQTSKYVQSYLGDCLKKCEEFLKDGRLVLFTGTSCQIEGLLNYLKEDYDNLITADLICSGNTSSGLWRMYLDYKKNEYNSDIDLISFRDKKYGWDRFSLLISFTSGKEYRRIFPNDSWAYFFLNHYAMRKCCYKCEYKSVNKHSADFTLGDFWGVREKFYNLYGKKYDDKGLSFVLVNSNKGAYVWEELDFLDVCELPLDTVKKHNTTIEMSAIEPKNRTEFYEDYKNNDFKFLENKWVNIKSWEKNNCLYNLYWEMRILIGDLYRKVKRRVR